MMFNASLRTTALANNNTSPVHINSTTSMLGVWSLRPVNKANKDGNVAQCITIAASHPSVSADIVCRCSFTKFLIAFKLKSFTLYLHKIYDDLFDQS